MVVSQVTLPTAENQTSNNHSGLNHLTTGQSLHRNRGAENSAVSSSPHDPPMEYGDRFPLQEEDTTLGSPASVHPAQSNTRTPTSCTRTAALTGTLDILTTPLNEPPGETLPGNESTLHTQTTEENAQSGIRCGPRGESSRKKNQNKKNTRASIKIATLNMRGRGADKWRHINQIMRDKKIGILALQETHLTDELAEQMQALFSKRLKIIHTIDPDRPNAMEEPLS